ncbi:MAG: type II secretion system F family protein, partial [Planctomycetota bacterium]
MQTPTTAMSQNGLPTAGAAPGLAKTGPSLLASLAAMTGSRLPLPDLLRAIAQEHPGAARHALQRLAERVESGVSLDEAFASTERLFPRGLRRPLQLAASAGNLQVALPALAVQEATRGDVRRRVVSALVYPAMVLCFAFGLAAFVAVAILPQFAGIFEEFELEGPFNTELLFRTAAVLPKAALVVG